MDIYRFFHPHHNPRLRRTPGRLQELSELEHVASELLRALERMQQRWRRSPRGPILPEHFTEIIKAARFVENSLHTLCEAHPGDTSHERLALAAERSAMSGWETWTRVFKETLEAEQIGAVK